MSTSEHRILVLGAGYSGLMCAIRAATRTRRQGARVTVVNPVTRFTERLRLHQIAAGQELADFQIPDLLRKAGADFVQGRATVIDPNARRVHVAGPDEPQILEYDTLVYALGSTPDNETVPGVADHAYTLNGIGGAERLAARLAELAPLGGRVVVCGGGLAGVEAAAEIADSDPGLRVMLLSRDVPGRMMGEKARRYLHDGLARLGVEVRSGTEVSKVMESGVELAGGEFVAADAVLWTGGVRASQLAAEAGLTVDERGLVIVDDTLRSVSHPEIFAVGDSALVRQAYGVIHGTCQSGIPTGAHAADEIARLLRGKKPKPFRFAYMHQPVSLGRKDGVIQFTRPDDSPRRFYLVGRSAVAYKEFFSSSPWKNYRYTMRYAGAVKWLKGGRMTRMSAMAQNG